MPEFVAAGPLDEGDLHDDRRMHPVRAQPWQALRDGERRLRNLERVEAAAKIEQQPGVEARADLSREDQVIALVVADEQRAEADAGALRVGEAADDELLRGFDLHLEPVPGAAMFVRRAA